MRYVRQPTDCQIEAEHLRVALLVSTKKESLVACFRLLRKYRHPKSPDKYCSRPSRKCDVQSFGAADMADIFRYGDVGLFRQVDLRRIPL